MKKWYEIIKQGELMQALKRGAQVFILLLIFFALTITQFAKFGKAVDLSVSIAGIWFFIDTARHYLFKLVGYLLSLLDKRW